MQIQSAYSAGLQGLQTPQSGLTQATIDVAKPTENQQVPATGNTKDTESMPDKTSALISAMSSERQGEASVNVLQRSNDMLGSIIDIEV